jgi:hypothetical protein
MPLLAVVGAVLLGALLVHRIRTRSRPELALASFYRSADPASLPSPQPDITFLDAFLRRWDLFAQGGNDLLPGIRRDTERFNAELARALQVDPSTAMSRAIMYPLLQIGGVVPVRSALGTALSSTLTPRGLPPTRVRGRWYYFAGDLYHWWEDHRGEFPPYPLYHEWRERDFARQIVIPFYDRTHRTGQAGSRS